MHALRATLTNFRARLTAEEACTHPCCALSDAEVDPPMLTDEQLDRLWAMIVKETA